MRVNIAAARAARAEARAAEGWEPNELDFGDGLLFRLPDEFPFLVGQALAIGNYDGALRALVDGQYDDVVAAGLNPGDLTEIIASLPKMYGFADEGESPASASPSKPGGSRRRRTSSASTASTSATSGPDA